MTYKAVIDFWFTECSPKEWFKKDAAFDALIRNRFAETYKDVVARKTKAWEATPEGALAEVIVLDQFARNMFRETPESFRNDSLALSIAQEAVKRGDDKKLSPNERHFLYMPYMHSESKRVHEEAVRLFSALGEEGGLKYELLHKEIIDRFGRYPHRNAILGRTSTPEEAEFLKTNKGF
jgi:uncharacterized protein (DUF924 family)